MVVLVVSRGFFGSQDLFNKSNRKNETRYFLRAVVFIFEDEADDAVFIFICED